MEYNFTEIGARIRTLRKEVKLTQDKFIEKLEDLGIPFSRNRLSSIENGTQRSFSLEFLMGVCEIFQCDMGYLLGEYDEKTRSIHDICEAIGLSEDAVNKLYYEHSRGHCRMEQFNQLIVNKELWEIVNIFCNRKNISKEIMEENRTRSNLYWKLINDQNSESLNERYRRVAISLEQKQINYDTDRADCQIRFQRIIDSFLPNHKA